MKKQKDQAQSPPEDQWKEVDRYLASVVSASDDALEAVLESNTSAGLPAIDVSPNQGKLLHLLAKIRGAARILEIGTLGGYSTIWLARALPQNGKLITLEVDPKHAQVARENITRAGLIHLVEQRLGPALDTLPKLVEEGCEPFDFIFIDADKANIPAYFEWSLKLARVGSVIIVDNVIRKGAVIDTATKDESVRGVQRFFDSLKQELRVSVTAIQTVGSKGYDGFALAVVISDGKQSVGQSSPNKKPSSKSSKK